jgi:hypothetical protein
MLRFKLKFWESLDMFMKERFDQDETSEDSIQSIMRLTWLRSMFFVLGTLLPAIKLAAMKGVPWTKTWGVMYLASL